MKKREKNLKGKEKNLSSSALQKVKNKVIKLFCPLQLRHMPAFLKNVKR